MPLTIQLRHFWRIELPFFLIVIRYPVIVIRLIILLFFIFPFFISFFLTFFPSVFLLSFHVSSKFLLLLYFSFLSLSFSFFPFLLLVCFSCVFLYLFIYLFIYSAYSNNSFSSITYSHWIHSFFHSFSFFPNKLYLFFLYPFDFFLNL